MLVNGERVESLLYSSKLVINGKLIKILRSLIIGNF